MLIRCIKITLIVAILGFVSFETLGLPQQSKTNLYNILIKQALVFEELRKPDSALILLQKAITLTAQPDSLAKLQLMIGNQYRLKNDFQKAMEYVLKVDIWLKQNSFSDSILMIERDHLAGKIYSNRGDYSLAIQSFDHSIEIAACLKSDVAIILMRIYNYRGITHYYLGDNISAMKDYKTAANICYTNRIEDLDFADILQNMAIVYSVNGQFDSAFFYINRSRIARETLLQSNDPRMGSFYLNYGRFLLMVGEVDESLVYYQKAESIMLEQMDFDQVLMGLLSINIGNAYQLRGDYEKAMLYYQNALNSFSKKLEDGHANIITVANNLAFANNQIGNYKESLDISKANSTKLLTAVSRIRLYRNMACSYLGLNNLEQADAYYKLAIQSSEEHFGHQHFELAFSLKDYADYLASIFRFEDAVINYNRALIVYQSVYGANDSEVADVIRNIAYCKTRLHHFKDAELLFFKAESILKASTNKTSFKQPDELTRIRLTDLYFDLGNLYYLWYQKSNDEQLLVKSFDRLKKAVELLDELGVSLTEESRMQLGENVRTRYAMAIEVSYQLYKITGDKSYASNAFAFAGKSKAAVLLASVKKLQAFTSVGVPEQILKTERKLREDMQAIRKINYEERQKTVPNYDRIAFLESRQFRMVRKYDSLLKQIEVDYPDYYSLRYKTGVISLNEVQHKLKDDELLLEYVLADSLYYSFAIAKDRFIFKRMSGLSQITDAVTKMRTSITSDFWGQGKSDFDQFISTSGLLYDNLIAPSKNLLSNKHLVIVPDGILGYLPFELLIDTNIDSISEIDRNDYASLSYLLIDHPISYAYSSTLLFANYSQKRKSRSNMLAVVPEYGKEKINNEKAIGQKRNLPFLPSLPFALDEAETVAKIWGGKVLNNEVATKANFLLIAKQYQILHLAMHTIIDDENPLYSRLVFQENSDSLDAYSMGTYELYSQKLDASLVVLSACNTGKGVLRYGEGVMSLTRGFIYAGVPSIVMTSWEVHDKSGSILMEKFYKYLKNGETKDVALQKAKIDFLKQSNNFKSHPFFWAAYMVIGDVSPLHVGFEFNRSIVLLILFFVAFVTFLILNRRKKWIRFEKKASSGK